MRTYARELIKRNFKETVLWSIMTRDLCILGKQNLQAKEVYCRSAVVLIVHLWILHANNY